MVASVFVSYRRDDSRHAAARLGERLNERFRLFMDIDSIQPGSDFAAVVREAVDQADVVLAVIGPAWLTSADETGARRIDKPRDWVALEIGTALARGTAVIPVLVDGARMPEQDELPPALAELATRQAINLTHESFAADCTRLIKTLDGLVHASEPEVVDLWVDPDHRYQDAADMQADLRAAPSRADVPVTAPTVVRGRAPEPRVRGSDSAPRRDAVRHATGDPARADQEPFVVVDPGGCSRCCRTGSHDVFGSVRGGPRKLTLRFSGCFSGCFVGCERRLGPSLTGCVWCCQPRSRSGLRPRLRPVLP